MQTLIILWEPNQRWQALSAEEKKDYLLALDKAVNEARSHGVMTLGWSKVDRSLPRAPDEGYVGVFAMSSAEDIHELDKIVEQSGRYDYSDSGNLSNEPEGGANEQPRQKNARR